MKPLAKIANGCILPALMGKSAMPTRNINLTAEQDAFVEEVVRAGKYQNASEAVRDALRALQLRHQQDELKLQALRTHVEAGVAALERGEFTEVEEVDLDAYFDDLATA